MDKTRKAKDQNEIVAHLTSGGQVIVHFKEVLRFQLSPKKIISFDKDVAVTEADQNLNINFDNPAVDFWELA